MANEIKETIKLKSEHINNIKSIYTYLQSACSLNSRIFIKKGVSYNTVEGSYISEVSSKEEGFFLLKDNVSFNFEKQQSIDFRIYIKSNYIDFSTAYLSKPFKDKNIHKFKFPKEITIYYVRDYTRVKPSKNNPVRVMFFLKQMKGISHKIKVTDIGVGGIGFEVPHADSIFNIGSIIEHMEISLPGEDTCILSGQIKFLKGKKCGIEFIQDNTHDLKKISRYVKQREIETIQFKKQKKEPEIGKGLQEEEQLSKGSKIKKDLKIKGTQKKAPKTIDATKESTVKKEKILIVDDSPPIQERFSKAFLKNNFEVIQAMDGMEGVKKAIETLPDMILMDVNMPLLNGHECTRIIKSQPTTRHIPICMFTTENKNELILKAKKLGVDDYIIKTMDTKFVLERIQLLLENIKSKT